MAALDDAPTVQPESIESWRAWLDANHARARGVWLVMWRPSSGRQPVTYEAAVEEALCFGWVDSRGGSVDEHRTRLYFAPRNPRSGWAQPNKERVARLMAAGRMAPAGIAAVEAAKQNGSWSVLDGPSRLEVPDDLAAALDSRPGARAAWDGWPPSLRKALLAGIAVARKPATRSGRIGAIVDQAARNQRPR